MVENDFLDAVRGYLARPGLLQPAPALIGIAEPVQNNELPAVVLSLENLTRLGRGLGERSAVITGGALPWRATIDLANPVLPEDPSLRLLDAARLVLTLPHGGLVRTDGSQGTPGPGDLKVSVDGVDRPVVSGAPTGLEVRPDPPTGRLTFATPLAPAGTLTADYFLGAWEQRVFRMTGRLRVAVWGMSISGIVDLSNSVMAALQAPAAVGLQGLNELRVEELGSIAWPQAAFPAVRFRSIGFGFEFEGEVNVPESSGGIIRTIPVNAFVG
jgi:hypothetical protein